MMIVNSRRVGPGASLPTKTAQSDVFQVRLGRRGDAPVALLSARWATDCFNTAIETLRPATPLLTSGIRLADGYIANAAEP